MKVRVGQYERRVRIAGFVASSWDAEFEIIHRGILIECPQPTAIHVPRLRLACLLLETTLEFAFWTLKPRRKDYGFGHLCPWDRNDLKWDGLCSHTAHSEFFRDTSDLSEKRFQEVAE